MTRRVTLIVGGTGMLGHKLAQVLGEADELDVHVVGRSSVPPALRSPNATYRDGVGLDAELVSIGRVLDELRPEIVINAAGAIKQREPGGAAADMSWINGVFPHALSARNPNRLARVIQISTDCVFRGDRGGYRESDAPDATDMYGSSKVAGELHCAPHLTLRTSMIGPEVANHLGLLEWFLRQPPGAVVPGFRQAIFSGLPTVTLSRTVLHIVREYPELTGLYHVASEPIDKCDLLGRLNSVLGRGREIASLEEPRIDRSLDDTRFREATRTRRPHWDELLTELATDFRSLPYTSR